MRTITVKLGKKDSEILDDIVKMLQKDWIDKMTISEAIRYAIYSQWCDLTCNFPNGDSCYNCTREHYLNHRKQVQ